MEHSNYYFVPFNLSFTVCIHRYVFWVMMKNCLSYCGSWRESIKRCSYTLSHGDVGVCSWPAKPPVLPDPCSQPHHAVFLPFIPSPTLQACVLCLEVFPHVLPFSLPLAKSSESEGLGLFS